VINVCSNPMKKRSMPKILWTSALLALGLLLVSANATTKDTRGWSKGTPAAASTAVLGSPEQPMELRLPAEVAARIERPTMLLYFSPGCPHCRAVAPELSKLEEAIKDKADILFVASAATTKEELAEFVEHFAISSPTLIDEERQIGAVMGITSTPSALFIKPVDGKIWIEAVWYPYFSGYDTLVKMKVNPADPWSAFSPGKYHGTRTCGACHQYEVEAWSLSHHSIAWNTLQKIKADKKPECVGCHVTGHQKPQGWQGEADHHLVDVGCESCHGPGGPHDGERDDANTTCTQCHDAKHSIAFSLEKGLPLIDHFHTVAMSDEDYVARRKELYKGEAPRQLLAFQEGEMLGAKACKECHSAEYNHWKRSPHARAMHTLDKGPEAECVQCHATAKASGPPSDAVSDYLTDEGVGCESCHGPGDAHVKARGGTDNIEKLGDDCPVCVIEAVCTRCHTQKWDPTWNLETKLPKVSHSPAKTP
jgi:thiol-disulfide isomerase/thioredoxin